MANEILTEIRLELDKFRSDLKDAQKLAEDGGKKAGDSLGSGVENAFGKAGAKIAATAAAIAGAVTAAFAIKGMIAEAREADQALQQFNSALFANGAFTNAASLKFQAYAESLQKTTTASNDLILKNAALMVNMTGMTGPALERATKAALDLAAGLQMDVGTAFNLVSKAAEGNTAILARHGIRIRETGTDAGNFAETLRVLGGRFGGLAEAQSKTFGGAMIQAWNNFSDLLKELGRFVTQSPLVIKVINLISNSLNDMAEAVKEFRGSGDLFGDATRSIVKFGASIIQYVIPPFELLFNVGKFVFNALVMGVQSMILNIVEPLAFVAEKISSLTGVGSGIADTMKGVRDSMRETLVGMATETGQSFSEMFDFGMTEKMQTAADAAVKFVTDVGATMPKLKDQIGPPVDFVTKKMIEFQNAIRSVVSQQMLSFVSGGIQNLATSLVKGGNAFDAFKNFALNALGDMSIRMGETMVVQSAAFAAMAALISNPFTAAAGSLAFGLALIALGAVLKAAAGGGGGAGTAGASAGGGGVAAAGGTGDIGGGGSAALTTPIQETKPGTSVVVNISGHVLDRRETGLAIADVINETFGSNGVTFATAGA